MKISDALVRFARPLLALLPPDATTDDYQCRLELARLVWNSVVLEELGRASAHFDQALELARDKRKGPELRALIALLRAMEKDKRGEAPPDLRVIGSFELSQSADGGFHLSVTQVAPPPEAEDLPTGLWAELYQAAREFHSLAAWNWMLDRDLFGVRDPASGEIGWCCVLGAGGELAGLAVYRGDAGFDFLRRLQCGELERDEAAFGQDALLLTFVDRADMDKRELKRLKTLGLTFRGARRWPQLESHAAGRLPIPLTDAEAERMLLTLRAVKEVALGLRDVPRWIEPDPRGRLIVRSLRAGEWHDERVAPPAPIATMVPEFDALRAGRLKRSLARGRAILECDLFPLPMVIEEPRGHHYSPASFLLVEPDAGVILHQQIGEPKDRLGMAQTEFMTGLERLGFLPAMVRVKRPSLANVLAPVGAALGVELRVVDDLPMVTHVQAMASEFFGKRTGSRRR